MTCLIHYSKRMSRARIQGGTQNANDLVSESLNQNAMDTNIPMWPGEFWSVRLTGTAVRKTKLIYHELKPIGNIRSDSCTFFNKVNLSAVCRHKPPCNLTMGAIACKDHVMTWQCLQHQIHFLKGIHFYTTSKNQQSGYLNYSFLVAPTAALKHAQRHKQTKAL